MQNIQQLESELATLEARHDDLAAQRRAAVLELAEAREAVVDGRGDVPALIAKQSAFDALAGACGAIFERVNVAREHLEIEKSRIEAAQLRATGERDVFEAVRAFESKAGELDVKRDEIRAAIFEKLPELWALMSQTVHLGRDAMATVNRVEAQTGAVGASIECDGERANVASLRAMNGVDIINRATGKQNGDPVLEVKWAELLNTRFNLIYFTS